MIEAMAAKKPKNDELARRLCLLYHEAVRADVLYYSGAGRMTSVLTYDEVDKTTREAFRKAAVLCERLEAQPREFVMAQFSRWREITKLKDKVVMPMPYHLHGSGAEIRFHQYKANQDTRASRKAPKVASSISFQREQRRLNGLSKMLRKLPEDVLVERPEDFSREFLELNNCWDVVADTWRARRGDS